VGDHERVESIFSITAHAFPLKSFFETVQFERRKSCRRSIGFGLANSV